MRQTPSRLTHLLDYAAFAAQLAADLAAARPPLAHQATHQTGGSDPLTPGNIGAEPSLGNPPANGHHLISQTDGTRTWVPMMSSGPPGTGLVSVTGGVWDDPTPFEYFATQSALDLKAPLASPALTGTPTAPTQSAGNNSTRLSTTAYVVTAVAAEAATRGSGDASLQTQLNLKATTAALTSETTARTAADSALTTALTTKADLVGGLVPSAQIPSLAITEYLGAVASEAAMLALTGQRGDWCNRTDGANIGMWIITAATNTGVIGDWTRIDYPASPVTEVNGQTGAVTLGKADLGLGNVENTSLSSWAGSGNITTLGTIASGSVPVSLITGLAASATTDALNASNISSGVLADARLSANVTVLGNTTSGTGNILKSAGTIVSTAGQTYTLPTTTATLARTDAAQTFTGTQTFGTISATGNVSSGGNFSLSSSVGVLQIGAFGTIIWNSDTVIKRGGAARTVQWGATTETTTYNIKGADAAGANVTGMTVIYTAGAGTGTGGSGSLKFQTASPAASSSTVNTLVDTLILSPDGSATFPRLPASVTPATNGHLMFEATSNTSFTIKFKGSDGTVRSVALTLA